MQDNTSQSPVFGQKKVSKMMSFCEALQEIEKGNKVTRLEWGTTEEYMVKKEDGFIGIHHSGEGEVVHRLLVKDGDYLAEDWMLISE